MAGEKSWWACHPSQWGFAWQYIASSKIDWKKEGEEGEFDHDPKVVAAVRLAGCQVQNN